MPSKRTTIRRPRRELDRRFRRARTLIDIGIPPLVAAEIVWR